MSVLNTHILLNRIASCIRSGSFLEGKVLCQQVLAKDKKNIDALAMLAQIESQSGDVEAGLDLYRRCAALKPRSVPHLTWLAQMLAKTGRYGEAIKHYEKALKLSPGNLEIIHGLATAHERLGDLDAAQRVIQSIVAAGTEDPAIATLHATIELQGKRPQNAVEILSKHVGAASQHPRLLFTLGKAYEQLKEYDHAFAAYAKANELEPRRFDVDAQREFTRQMLRVFSASAFKRMPRARNQSQLPVLVTGRPRSGTTLVGRIIGAHPQGHDGGELPYLTNCSNRLSLEIGSINTFPESAADLDQDDVDRLGDEYIAHLKNIEAKAARFVDKNLSNVAQMGFVNLLVPRAACILCARDPIDCGFSIFAEPFSILHTYASSLLNIGLSHELTELLRQYWLRTLDMPVMEMRYEDLIDKQEAMSREIIKFCGLEWSDECLRYYEPKNAAKRSGNLTLSYEQVRQPIYKTSMGRAQRFARHLEPLYEGLRQGRRMALEIAREFKLEWFEEVPSPCN